MRRRNRNQEVGKARDPEEEAREVEDSRGIPEAEVEDKVRDKNPTLIAIIAGSTAIMQRTAGPRKR